MLAYKDEYEVARLYTSGEFAEKLNQQFAGDFKLQFHLAPPLFSRRDARTGHLQKMTLGPWIMKAFGVLAKLRGLRGTAFDIFGYTAERKMERRLIADYEIVIAGILEKLNPDNHKLAVEIASIPEHIRGYGHVKEKHLHDAKEKERLCWHGLG